MKTRLPHDGAVLGPPVGVCLLEDPINRLAPTPPAMRPQQDLRLGERLVVRGWVTAEQLEAALELNRRTGGFLGETLLDSGSITAAQLGAVLEEIYGVPYVDLSMTTIDPSAAALIPEKLAHEKLLLPLRLEDDRLITAMVDPLDLSAADELRMISGKRVTPMVTTARELQRALIGQFSPLARAHDVLDSIQADIVQPAGPSVDVQAKAAIDEAPIVRLTHSILQGAVAVEASDIHLEPQEIGLRVRFRVDGMLQEHMLVPRAQQAAVLSRIKIVADMDIAETRRPQDGRAVIQENGRDYDLRVSSLPTVHGEKIVLRVLNKEAINVPLEKLGFLPEQLRHYEALSRRSYGMILVTGPTGSGKSTTLYATLSRLNQPHLNITTIEDPVEYQLAGISQTQANPRIGLTFAAGLRTVLRQDPDIILVGEIRDRETAEVAIQAALTGHLVFSTLHTNTAAGAIMRLMNMEIEPFLIASALAGVVAQRLVRRVCSRCAEEYHPTPEELTELRLNPAECLGAQFKRGRGCRHCGNSGYRGRTAVHEVLRMTQSMRNQVLQRCSTSEVDALAAREGMQSLQRSAAQKVVLGVTTPEEAMRVIHTDEDDLVG